MRFLFDLFPVILFFAAYKLAGIYVATAVAIGATFLQIGLLAALRRKIDTMLWVSLGIIVVFGGATLALRDETFIKWKPTVLYWLFAAALAGAELLFRRNLIRAMLGKQVRLPDPVWSRLNWSWAAFFALMGVANLYVAFMFSESFCTNVVEVVERNNCENNIWVNFKLFGATGLMLLFVIGQALFLARHVQDDKPQEEKP
jgi:intracellular septation protein